MGKSTVYFFSSTISLQHKNENVTLSRFYLSRFKKKKKKNLTMSKQITIWISMYTNSTTPLLQCPEIGGSHPFFCWIHRNNTQYILFDIQFTYWLQETNVPRLCKSGSVNRGPNTVNACWICVYSGMEWLVNGNPRHGQSAGAGSTAPRKLRGKLRKSLHWCNWDIKRSFHFQTLFLRKKSFYPPLGDPMTLQVVLPISLSRLLFSPHRFIIWLNQI